ISILRIIFVQDYLVCCDSTVSGKRSLQRRNMYFSNKERFYKYPGRLTWLCAQTLGKFVSSLMVKLVHQKEQHLVKETCDYLQEMLHSSLPQSIAYEMKDRMCGVYLTSRTTGWVKMRSSDLIYNAIYKLKNVTALRIADATYWNGRHELGEYLDQRITENLKEYRNGLSSNQEIITLFEQCKKLRILDIGDSVDVYEESIHFILNMQCLEELDIHYTSIFSTYTDELLNGFVNTKRSDKKFASRHLKNLGCDSLSQKQICLIGQKFPNLTCLKVMHVDCDLIPLKGLKHLKHLQVGVRTYQYLEKLLTCIGKQLVCLDVKNTSDVDLQHVASTCTSLICLHLGNNPLFEDYSMSL
ncbi:hypothetical protein L9F63_022936, partial [Diploptera punctata]